MIEIKISTTNSKLGVIPSINLPTTVCRHDAPCKKGCYAKKGNWLFPNVKESLANNLASYISDSESFFNQVIDYLNKGLVSYRYFRWHSSGEIVDYTYLLGIIKVAKKCKQTKFLCYTKKFDLVNKYLNTGAKLPSNLSIVFSGWDKDFVIDNPYGLPTTLVDFKDKALNANIPNDAFECVGSCEICQKCWNLKKGKSVVFHQH